jgi:hypothetical protein
VESKQMNDKSRTKHKRYDEAFKRQAVEHWMVSGFGENSTVAWCSV